MGTVGPTRSDAVITDAQVKAINAARTVLADIEKANLYDYNTQASGMIVARAASASDSLFQLLNWYDSHAHGQLTSEQLHNGRGVA